MVRETINTICFDTLNMKDIVININHRIRFEVSSHNNDSIILVFDKVTCLCGL